MNAKNKMKERKSRCPVCHETMIALYYRKRLEGPGRRTWISSDAYFCQACGQFKYPEASAAAPAKDGKAGNWKDYGEIYSIMGQGGFIEEVKTSIDLRKEKINVRRLNELGEVTIDIGGGAFGLTLPAPIAENLAREILARTDGSDKKKTITVLVKKKKK